MGIGNNDPTNTVWNVGLFRVISNILYLPLSFQAGEGGKGKKKEGRQREEKGQS